MPNGAEESSLRALVVHALPPGDRDRVVAALLSV